MGRVPSSCPAVSARRAGRRVDGLRPGTVYDEGGQPNERAAICSGLPPRVCVRVVDTQYWAAGATFVAQRQSAPLSLFQVFHSFRFCCSVALLVSFPPNAGDTGLRDVSAAPPYGLEDASHRA